MADFDEFLKELLFKADIVSIVSKYVPLTPKGNSHWGCCPFHHEKTPSMQVTSAKGIFYCYGCHTGGNAITFLSKIENISKFEAIKALAAQHGMEMPQSDFRGNDKEQEEKKKARLTALLKDAALHYHQNLFTKDAAIATDYLNKRGLTDPSIIRRFAIGYSAGFSEVITHLSQKGYSLAEMREAGIATQKADKHYDVFFKRLMFPIIDHRDNVVGFGGRILEGDGFAKYRNTSGTVVFDKSRILYGLNLVKKRKQKEGLKYIIITEGYMDTIALNKAGFDMTVASMGTSLTTAQARLLKAYCDNVYISYDGDSAGQKATLRGLDILAEAGLNVKIINLPEGLDPDDVINQRGKEEYIQLIKNALTLPAFKIESLRKGYDLNSPDGKSAFAAEAVKMIKRLESPVEREEYLGVIHKLTGYSKEVLYVQADLPEPVKDIPEIKKEPAPDADKVLTDAAEFILAQTIAAKPYVDRGEDIYSLLIGDDDKRIYCLIVEAQKESGYTPGLLYAKADESDEPRINKLLGYESLLGDDVSKYRDCVDLLKHNKIKNRIEEIKKEFAQSRDNELLSELKALQKETVTLRRRN